VIYNSLAKISSIQLLLLFIFSGCSSDGTGIIPIPDFPFDTSGLRENEQSSVAEPDSPRVEIREFRLREPRIVKDLTMPVFLNRSLVHPKHPQIPGIAKATVILELWIELNGKPGDIRLLKIETEPPRPYDEVDAFAEASIEAARQFRFEPAREGDDKTRALVHVPIAFDLKRGTAD
jgi:hypothetical protein